MSTRSTSAAFDAREGVKQWLAIAIASLVAAGLLAVLLVVGRLPGIAGLFHDALLFKRALVVHVDLSFIVWFYAFIAMLGFLLPATQRPSLLGKLSSRMAWVGITVLAAAALVPGASPVLSNYVPVIDHPVFVVGLAIFALGVLCAVVDRRLVPPDHGLGFFRISEAPAAGIRAAVMALVLAALTFAASALTTARTLPTDTYYELVVWGGGHVLQFANVAAMSAVWLILLESAIGEAPISYPVASRLYALLILPLLAAPALAFFGTGSGTLRQVFTELMRWGIFPVVTTIIVLCVRKLLAVRRERPKAVRLSDPAIAAFCASAALTLAGFVLGACIRGSSTVIPGHYHASIGAVTVAYMALSYRLLERLRLPLPEGRSAWLRAWQPPIFGVGQLVFALGFALAGAHGMARKTYGAEQHIRSLGETLGLGIMGLGGIVAVAAGVTFLWIAMRAWLLGEWSASAPAQTNDGGMRWNKASIRSRS